MPVPISLCAVRYRKTTGIVGRRPPWGGALLGGLLSVTAAGASASPVEFDYNIEFSGGQAPGGTTPWITSTFTDINSGPEAGAVELTISTLHLVQNENVSEADFNILPSLDTQLANLVFTPVSGTLAATAINTGPDAFKADGDGKYDIQLMYTTGSGFGGQQFSSYYITDPQVTAGTITAQSFDTLSTPMGGHGPFRAAAHVQNTTGAGSGGSGWIAPAPVPIPTAGWLLLSGLVGLVAFARISRRRASLHG
jgi:hypothetical protein